VTRAGARFGIVFLPESLGDFGRLCREAEEAGFDLLGVADSQSVFRELYVALAVAARDTSRIRGPRKEYDAHQHEIAGAVNADLTERWGLTEFLRDRFGIAGTPDDCVAQVRRAMAAGARQFVVTAFVPEARGEATSGSVGGARLPAREAYGRRAGRLAPQVPKCWWYSS